MQSISEYVSCFKDYENVYYLNKAGRERIGATIIRRKISPVTHYLMRNDFFIHNNPEIFKTEQRITVGDSQVITDAWVKLKGGYYFLEVDNTQRMVKNEQKIARYKRLKETGVFQEKYGYFPRIIWVTALASRKKLLSKACDGLGSTVVIWDEIR